MEEIIVSVCILTYYHEKYIRQAIESALSQKTKYNYEIVIFDDFSQDGTRDILKEYAARYPNLIRVHLNSENLGIPKNMFLARCACKGKYIVNLSGDDYWIDDFKIQKQVDFLETHPDYFAVFNTVEMRYDDDDKPSKVNPPVNRRNKDYTLNDYEKNVILYSHGFMMRNAFLTEEGRDYFKIAQTISDAVDDAVDNYLIVKRGKVFVMNDVMNVYRATRNKSNKHNYNSRFSRYEKSSNSINLYNSMYTFFKEEVDLTKRYLSSVSVLKAYRLFDKEKQKYNALLKTIPQSIWKKIRFKSSFNAIAFCIRYIFSR